jgi:hypothetical protein
MVLGMELGELVLIALIVIVVFAGTRLDRWAPEIERWSRSDWILVATAALLSFAARHQR